MSVGVIGHLVNPSIDDVVELAGVAEDAGADWLGLPDAFWWRDVWMLLAAAARATSRLELGPAMTNPYLRHPFHTVAALATLQELAGPRVFAGLAAGGSEVSGAAHLSRADAPRRVGELAELLAAVAAGVPLDPASGRHLDLKLLPVPVLIAGRGDRMLRVAGTHAHRALLFAVPGSDLARTAGVLMAAAASGRVAPGARPDVVWAPLVAHDESVRPYLGYAAVYAALNAAPAARRRWGLDAGMAAAIRAELLRGGTARAADLVPAAALDDLIVRNPEAAVVADQGRRVGATSIAIPSFATSTLASRIGWARQIDALLASGPPATGP